MHFSEDFSNLWIASLLSLLRTLPFITHSTIYLLNKCLNDQSNKAYSRIKEKFCFRAPIRMYNVPVHHVNFLVMMWRLSKITLVSEHGVLKRKNYKEVIEASDITETTVKKKGKTVCKSRDISYNYRNRPEYCVLCNIVLLI